MNIVLMLIVVKLECSAALRGAIVILMLLVGLIGVLFLNNFFERASLRSIHVRWRRFFFGAAWAPLIQPFAIVAGSLFLDHRLWHARSLPAASVLCVFSIPAAMFLGLVFAIVYDRAEWSNRDWLHWLGVGSALAILGLLLWFPCVGMVI